MGSEGNPKVREKSDPGAKIPKQIALLETRLGSFRMEQAPFPRRPPS